MVNMYGAGKAFNLRYQQNNYRMMPRPGFQHAAQKAALLGCHGHHHCGPQNVTINQGPQGFWGFMTGLFGGLFGGGMMGMGGLLGGMSPYGMLNQALSGTQKTEDQTQAQDLQRLKTLFPDYKIVPEKDGGFSAISKDGHSIISGDYETMQTKLSEDLAAHSKDKAKSTGDDDGSKAKGAGEGDGSKAQGTGKGDGNNKTQGTGDGGGSKAKGTGDNNGYKTQSSGTGQATPVGKDDLKAGVHQGRFTVHDTERGRAGDLTRNTYVVGVDNAQGYPESITVGGYKYDFKEIDDKGNIIYKSVHGAGQEYRLEKNADGTFGLNQYAGMVGSNEVDLKNGTPGIQVDAEVTTQEATYDPNTKYEEFNNEAQKLGAKVAEQLNGYTRDGEAEAAHKTVMNDVNSQNVTNFIQGYRNVDVNWEIDAIRDAGIFEQIGTEYGHADKYKEMSDKLLGDLIKHFENNPTAKNDPNYTELKNIQAKVSQSGWTAELREQADNLSYRLIEKYERLEQQKTE